ncbi:MAG: hypothetical protein OEV06_06430 [Anaerolineae bacterium]|nr:hypothetical protein [Anaerolineae bacterium]
MAVTISAYNDGKMKLLDGAIDLDNDTIKLSLHTSSYSPDIDGHTFFSDISNELAASGNYTAGGKALSGKSVTADDVNDRAVFDGDDVSWAALTPSAAFRYGVIYKDSGVSTTSPLIAYLDFGADQNPAGSDFTVQWHADGILYI